MKIFGTLLAATVLLFITADTQADAILEVTTGSGASAVTTTYTDDDGDGVISADQNAENGWMFLVEMMASQPAVDGMLMNIFFIAGDQDVEAVLYFSDNDFETSSGSTTLVVDAVEGSVSGSVANWWGLWADSGNETLARTTTVFAPRAYDYTGSRSVELSEASTLYSVTMGIGLDVSAGSFGSIDYAVKVPEPGTLALLVLGLLGAGWSRRRRVHA